MPTQTDQTLFSAATDLHRKNPTLESLAIVVASGRLLIGGSAGTGTLPASAPTVPSFPVAIPFTTVDKHIGDFSEIRLTFDRLVSSEEALTAAACTGYALKKYFNGEEVGDPVLTLCTEDGERYSRIVMPYDSTKAQRSNPDTEEAFELAAQYVQEGTPVRTTNRAGKGTQGTRLSAGIGKIGLTFEIR